MKPAYTKIALMLALAVLALRYDNTLCGLAAILMFFNIDDEDYR